MFNFGKKNKTGGLMNVIRCDEEDYLIWKWRPNNHEANSTKRENEIRYNSSLRVKDGEVAVFVYKQKDGETMQDFIVGPHDDTIKTANFPILTSLVGLGFGGHSPFQAEIYFISLAKVIQVKFGVPYFDIFDPRLMDTPIPVCARGTITVQISDYKEFIKFHRLIDFSMEKFYNQIKDSVIKRVKSVISNVPTQCQIQVAQIERKILEISDVIEGQLKDHIQNNFGVRLVEFDLAHIELDKESEGYHELRLLTSEQQRQTILTQNEINLKNLRESQRINAENLEETLRIQREESQRAQRLRTEQENIGAHSINLQSQILNTAAQNLGQAGSLNLGGDSGTMNPANMMTGMALGGAMGGQMANMMNMMGAQMNSAMNNIPNAQTGMPTSPQMGTPPPPPIPTEIEYMLVVNGKQCGPFNKEQLCQLITSGQLTLETYAWKQGMAQWEFAKNIPELSILFAPSSQSTGMPPPIPNL